MRQENLNTLKKECTTISEDLDLHRAEVSAKPYESSYVLACLWANRDALCHALHRLSMMKEDRLYKRIKAEYKRYEGFGPGMYKWLELL